MLIKRKRTTTSTFSFLTEPFEFVSPLSLEECVETLRSKSEPWRLFSFRNPLKVEVTQIDADTYQFELRRDAGRNLVVQAVGVLERDEEGTVISGQGQLQRLTLAFMLLILVVQFPIFGAMFGPGILVLDVAIIAVFWLTMAAERHRLVQLLPNTLGVLDGIAKIKTDTLAPRRKYQKSVKKNLTEIGLFAIAVVFILSIASGFRGNFFDQRQACSVTAASPRPVLTSDVKITPLWGTKIDIEIGSGKDDIAIGAGKLLAPNCGDITAFDLRTGQQIWVAERPSEWPGGISGQMTVDELHNRVYARKNQWGIRAFSLNDGKIVWTNEMTSVPRAMPYIDLLSDGRVVAQDSGQTWMVDPDTGQLLPTGMQTSDGNLPQVVDDLALNTCETCLRAWDSRSGLLKWKFTSADNEVVSNAAVDNDTVYVMDQTAKIFLLDAKSGKQLGSIQFTLPQNQQNLLYQSGQIGGSSIAVRANIIAVYFHDTTTLSVYEMD